MNCKPGDLAIIVRSDFAEDIGSICEVVAAVDPLDWMDQGLPEWRCTSTRIGRVYDTETGQDKLSLDFDIPDALLRPVSGLPIDEDATEDLKEPA